jgi:hypothetical protein
MPEADAPPPAPSVIGEAAPTGLPYEPDVERWRPQVRTLLAEAKNEGRLEGNASAIDEDLVLAVITQESGGDPNAESGAGALGLMQLMPETFSWAMGIHDWGEDVSDVPESAILDVESNLRAGIRCLAAVLDEQGGNLYWALASYNAGGGVVNAWRAAGMGQIPSWGGYGETAEYAPAILSNYADHHPGAEVSLPPPPPPIVPVAPAPLRPPVRVAAPARRPAVAPAAAPVQRAPAPVPARSAPRPAPAPAAPRPAAPRR